MGNSKNSHVFNFAILLKSRKISKIWCSRNTWVLYSTCMNSKIWSSLSIDIHWLLFCLVQFEEKTKSKGGEEEKSCCKTERWWWYKDLLFFNFSFVIGRFVMCRAFSKMWGSWYHHLLSSSDWLPCQTPGILGVSCPVLICAYPVAMLHKRIKYWLIDRLICVTEETIYTTCWWKWESRQSES